ncbi:MAG: hypothetical protein C5B54_01765 [Acidobacteria bacterium]|nr:MAG: hypothetical protein C5B54_01765 [Acidobacteriota bacterium]
MVMHKSESRQWLIWILAITLVSRLLVLIFFSDTLSFRASGYDAYATHVLQQSVYTQHSDGVPDSDLPPLYPLLLAGLYSLFGHKVIPVSVFQIALDLLTALLMYLIGKRVADAKVGLLAAMFYGIYPYLLYQNVSVNDTAVFIFLLTVSIFLTYKTRDSLHPAYAAAVGATVGLAALTKPFIMLLLPFSGFWWIKEIGFRNGIKFTLLSSLILLTVLAPWVTRNLLLHKQWVFISTNGGSNLHQGNNSCVVDYLRHGWDAQWVNCLKKLPDGLNEVEADQWHRQQAIAYLLNHPAQWPRLFGMKFLVLWNPAITPSAVPPGAQLADNTVLQYQSGVFQFARVVHIFYFTPLLILGVGGLILASRRKLCIGPPVILILLTTAVYVLFHPSTRYRSPLDPFVFIFSAYAVTQLKSLRIRQPNSLLEYSPEKNRNAKQISFPETARFEDQTP